MDDLKVAVVCMDAIPGEAEKNLRKIRSFALEASANGADIVCFPELSVTGYILKHPHNAYAGIDSGRAIDRLTRLAQEARLLVIAGLIENSDGPRPFITQVIAGPYGLVGLHRKTHLSPPEKMAYLAGTEIEVYSYRNTTLGVQLCYEAHFPEISTIMALMGADIIFLPHASPRGTPSEKLKSWLRHLPARAFDNGFFLVACNQVGETDEGISSPGVALVLGPDGQILERYAGPDEKLIFARLEPEKLENLRQHRMKYFLPQRRPELYRGLVETTIK